jgi:hypothetical protein
MRIAREEIFGPVTGVIDWEDEADLLRSVNDSIYGLGGGLWTRSLARAHRISRGMETGTVWINRYYNFKPGQTIGGYKQSGFGRENALATLNDYTITKSVVINLDEGEPLALDRPLYKAQPPRAMDRSGDSRSEAVNFDLTSESGRQPPWHNHIRA